LLLVVVEVPMKEVEAVGLVVLENLLPNLFQLLLSLLL
jgi:hypothetical protein